MKKQLCLILSLFVLSVTAAHAQNNALSVGSSERAQSIYFEILGSGVTYSFNYDTRFQDTRDGLGGRIGLSYISIDDNSVFTLPAMLNYLLGKEGKYFEMGLGATYVSTNDDDAGLYVDEPNFIGTMVFGYRSQPVDGGFMFRGGVAPIISEGDFIPYYPYLSFGYTF